MFRWNVRIRTIRWRNPGDFSLKYPRLESVQMYSEMNLEKVSGRGQVFSRVTVGTASAANRATKLRRRILLSAMKSHWDIFSQHFHDYGIEMWRQCALCYQPPGNEPPPPSPPLIMLIAPRSILKCEVAGRAAHRISGGFCVCPKFCPEFSMLPHSYLAELLVVFIYPSIYVCNRRRFVRNRVQVFGVLQPWNSNHSL